MVSKAPNRPELLAPAGNFFSLEAALLSGADAVYFGCGRFNARSEAASFEEADLPRIMSAVRRAGAKGYLALNTLIYENEFPAALKLALEAFRTGVDGLILQDIGLARLLRRFLPELPLHASTQMTAGSLSALPALRELGIKRIILPRELSLEDIAALTRKAHELDMETEVFVQGALCVSVSGQCSLSRLRGGRSANRGECAGPCRLPWQLLEDNQPRGACAPCLSPKDQSALTFLERVRETDTDALKIEGVCAPVCSHCGPGISAGVGRRTVRRGSAAIGLQSRWFLYRCIYDRSAPGELSERRPGRKLRVAVRRGRAG